MLETLLPALSKISLHIAEDKCVILHNHKGHDARHWLSCFFAAGFEFQILPVGAYHKYLGRHLSLQAGFRMQTEVFLRMTCAWSAYTKLRSASVDHNIPAKLRAKLFEATVTPCALFGLACLTLTRADMHHSEVTQRKMLRNIVGWRRLESEPWPDTIRRMRDRTSCSKQT